MFDATGMYLLLGVLFLAGAALFALYLLQCFAIWRMAKKAGHSWAGLAWVPFAQSWLLGWLCDRACAFRNGKNWCFRVILPILSVLNPPLVVTVALGFFSIPTPFELSLQMGLYYMDSLFKLVGVAGSAFALYYLYADYAPGQEAVYTVLSVVLASFAPPVLLFLLRERTPLSAGGEPPRAPRWQGTGTTGGPGWQPPGWQGAPPPPGPVEPPPAARPPVEPNSGGWYQPEETFQRPYRSRGKDKEGPEL